MHLFKKISYLVISLLLLFSIKAQAFNLVGTWKLISIANSDYAPNVKCHSPTGLIIYTANGYMAVGINCMKSDSDLTPDFSPTNVTFYMGKYFVEGDKITHVVQNTSDQYYYGKKLERKLVVLNDNEILLMIKRKDGKFVELKFKRE